MKIKISNINRKINVFYILFGIGLILNCLRLFIRNNISDFTIGFLEGISIVLILGCGIILFVLKLIKSKNTGENS